MDTEWPASQQACSGRQCGCTGSTEARQPCTPLSAGNQTRWRALAWAAVVQCTHQQVLIQLQVALILRQVRSSVQGRKSSVIPLVDLSSAVQQVVHLWDVQTYEAGERDSTLSNSRASQVKSSNRVEKNIVPCPAACRLWQSAEGRLRRCPGSRSRDQPP